MENRKLCPIEEALFKIEASAKTNRSLINTLFILQKIISNFLSSSNQTHEVFDQENKHLLLEVSECEDTRQFLELIGFRDGNLYEHGVSDEEMKCLEAALKIVNTHLHKISVALLEERPIFEVLKESPNTRSQKLHGSADTQFEKILESKSRCAKLQEMLSRHLKQERIEALCNWKKNEASDASFNSEGYFYQTSQKKDKRKRKCFFEEMFDRHDFNNNKKGCAFFPYLKIG